MSWMAGAVRRLRPLPVALGVAGCAVLSVVGLLWLQIPDSYAWEFVLSVVLAAGLLVGGLWLYTSLLRGLRTPAAAARLWLGMALLAGWAVLWWVMVAASSHIMDNASQRAGYWNSQLSASMRVYFTYMRLWSLQDDAVIVLLWVVIPGLLLPFVVETVCCGGAVTVWARGLRTLVNWRHWVVVAFATTAAYWVTEKLIAWHPSYSVRGELMSAVLRVGTVYLLDAMLAMVAIASTAELLAECDGGGNALAQPLAENGETVVIE